MKRFRPSQELIEVLNPAKEEAFQLGANKKDNCDTVVEKCRDAVNRHYDAKESDLRAKLSYKQQARQTQVSRKNLTQNSTHKDTELKKRAEVLILEKKVTNRKYALLIAKMELNQANAAITSFDKENPGLHPIAKTLSSSRWFIMVITSIMVFGEVPFTFTVLQDQLAIPMMLVAITSTMMAMLLGFTAHFATKGWLAREKKIAALALGTGMTVVATQVILRLNMPGENHLILGVLNIALYTGNLVFAWWGNRYREVWAAKSEGKKRVREIAKHQADVDNEPKDRELIEIKFDLQTEAAKQNGISNIQRNETQLETECDDIEQSLASLSTARQQTISYCIAEINEAFQKGQGSSNNTFGFPRAAALSLIILAFVAVGCKEKVVSNMVQSGVSKTEASLSWDKSESTELLSFDPPHVVSNFLMDDLLGFNNEVNLYNGARVTLSMIGESGLPKLSVYELPAGEENPLLRVKKSRMEQVIAFRQDVTNAIDSFCKAPANQSNTNLARAQAYQLNTLRQSNFAEKKYYVRFSDGLEQSSLVSFSGCNNIQVFRKKFDKTVKTLDANCNVGDLSGINVLLICNPLDAPSTDIVEATNEFWKHYLGEVHKANVSVLSNLN